MWRRLLAGTAFVLSFGAAAGLACGGDAATTPSPPPERDARVREILFDNAVIQAVMGGRQLGRDFWIVDVSHPAEPVYGAWESKVVMVLAEPASYWGEVPTASQPCKGHSGPDERLDEDDPCLDEPREYGTKFASFSGIQVIHATVDVIRGQVVVFIMDDDVERDIVEDMIGYAKQKQIWTTPTAAAPP